LVRRVARRRAGSLATRCARSAGAAPAARFQLLAQPSASNASGFEGHERRGILTLAKAASASSKPRQRKTGASRQGGRTEVFWSVGRNEAMCARRSYVRIYALNDDKSAHLVVERKRLMTFVPLITGAYKRYLHTVQSKQRIPVGISYGGAPVPPQAPLQLGITQQLGRCARSTIQTAARLDLINAHEVMRLPHDAIR
ncbi:Hypothetical protein, partial CDS, partial [Neorhizobium galegae bv. orientalis]